MKKQLLKISSSAILLALCSVTFAAYTAPVRTLVIPKATSAVDINDLDDETFYSASQTMNAFNIAGCADYPSADFTSSFKVCYDDVNIYIFGSCIDDIDHSYTGSGNTYQFDNQEIFINLDTNECGVTAYDNQTQQLRVNRNIDTVAGGHSRSGAPCTLMTESTGTGWSYEVAIPWTLIMAYGKLPEDILPLLTLETGFDMSGADSDGTDPLVGARDCQTAWDDDVAGSGAEEDLAWNNVAQFGVVTFAGQTPGVSTQICGAGIDNTTTTAATVYPNPTTGSVTFDNIQGATSIEIMNLAGQVVLTSDVTNSNVVDMSQLTSGIYIARVGQDFVKVVKN
jgi:hypothetical protein